MSRVVKQGSRKPTAKGVAGRIRKLGESKRYLKFGLYGRSGTGKTTLWGTFPKPTMAILASGGKDPGELMSIDIPEYRDHIDVIAINNCEEVFDIVDHCKKSSRKYKTVVMDHITRLQDYVVKHTGELDELPLQMDWGTLSQAQWGSVSLKMKEILTALLDLEMNTVLVAQEREFNADDESRILMPWVGPAVSPATAGWVNNSCDYVCQTFIKEKTVKKSVKAGGKTKVLERPTGTFEFWLRTGHHSMYQTKFRMPIERGKELPPAVLNPTYEKVMKLIKG